MADSSKTLEDFYNDYLSESNSKSVDQQKFTKYVRQYNSNYKYSEIKVFLTEKTKENSKDSNPNASKMAGPSSTPKANKNSGVTKLNARRHESINNNNNNNSSANNNNNNNNKKNELSSRVKGDSTVTLSNGNDINNNNNNNGVSIASWCQSIGLGDYADGIQEYAETLADLSIADDSDIAEIIKELKIPIKLKLKFKKAVIALRTQSKLSNAVTTKSSSDSSGSMAEKKEESKNVLRLSLSSEEENKDEDEKEFEGFVLKPNMPIKVGTYIIPTISKKEINGNWKTIMVIGETGSGKSTTLNSMINYLWDVDLNDHYRWVLIPPPKDNKKQGDSVTSDVTSYHIRPPKLTYGLTIVDTPGFGDTKGMSTDAEIVNKIEYTFKNELDTIDAVFFVLKASQSRLTVMQTYVFNSMLRLFGNDIADNLFLLITFCDGDDPPVYASVEKYELPYKKAFELNNSAFFTGFKNNCQIKELNVEKDCLQSLSKNQLLNWIKNKPQIAEKRKTTSNFWQMGMDAMENLFKTLDKTNVKSLHLCRQVLDLRKQLTLRIQNLHNRITIGLNLIGNIRKLIDTIKIYAKEVNSSKDFEIPDEGTRLETHKTDLNTTTCLSCKYTCHEGCAYDDNAEKMHCFAMDGDGNCTICPSKCRWNVHKNENYIFVNVPYKTTTTLNDLKAKFDKSTEGMTNSERIIISKTQEIIELQAQVSEDIYEVRICIETLSDIALKPCVMEEDGYYELMIDSETEQRNPGWKERVKVLKALRQQAEQVRLVQLASESDAQFKTGKLFESQLKQLKQDLQDLKKVQGDAPQEASDILERVSNKIEDTAQGFEKASVEHHKKCDKEKKTLAQRAANAVSDAANFVMKKIASS